MFWFLNYLSLLTFGSVSSNLDWLFVMFQNVRYMMSKQGKKVCKTTGKLQDFEGLLRQPARAATFYIIRLKSLNLGPIQNPSMCLTKERHKMCDHPNFFEVPDQLAFPAEASKNYSYSWHPWLNSNLKYNCTISKSDGFKGYQLVMHGAKSFLPYVSSQRIFLSNSLQCWPLMGLVFWLSCL